MRSHEQSKAKALERRKKRLKKRKSKTPTKKVYNPVGFNKGSFIPPRDEEYKTHRTEVLKIFDTNAWKPDE